MTNNKLLSPIYPIINFLLFCFYKMVVVTFIKSAVIVLVRNIDRKCFVKVSQYYNHETFEFLTRKS